MNITQYLKIKLKKLRDRVINPPNVFENEVADIRTSNENVRRYSIQHLRKEFFSIKIKGKDDIFKYLFYLLCLILLLLLPLGSIRNGISEKEIQQNKQAEALYQYYANGDKAIKEMPGAIDHPQVIDLVCYSLCKWLHVSHVYEFRHIIGALLAWLIIVLTGSFLMNLFTWRAAFLGSCFLFISPHFLAQSFGNLDDTAFAFFYLLSLYQIYTFIGELPIIKWKRLVFIVLAIAAANSIHVGGFALLHYLFLFSVIAFVIANPISKIRTLNYWRNFLILLVFLFGMSFAVYILFILYPLQGFRISEILPGKALQTMAASQLPTEIFWHGHLISSKGLTLSFIFERMQISIPLLIILGCLLHFIVIKTTTKTIHVLNAIILIFAIIYPFWKLSGSNYEISDGWSLYMMVYPLIVMFSVAGCEGLLFKVDDRYTNFVIVSAILLLSLMPLRHVLFHYPTVGVYFNELSGGIATAYDKYSIDEGESANKEICNWLISNNPNIQNNPPVILTNGNSGCDYFLQNCDAPFIVGHTSWNEFSQNDSLKWDYYCAFVNQQPINERELTNGPNATIVYQLQVENKAIAYIIKNNVLEKLLPVTDSLTVTDSDIK